MALERRLARFLGLASVQLWHVPAEEIPAGTEARIDWLFRWWQTLDAWVAE